MCISIAFDRISKFERDMGFNISGVWNNVQFNLMGYEKKSFKKKYTYSRLYT